MVIEKEKFLPYKDQEERDQEQSKVITIRLNLEELRDLEELARLLRQEKLGTTVKQLMKLGSHVLHSPQTAWLVDTLFINEKNNKRMGIINVNPKFKQL
jgi:hypothetical protein